MSPYDSPATFSLLQGTEILDGIWYPRGGFQQVLGALENIAKKNGAQFNYSSPVKEVIIDPKTNKATGITLENGEKVTSDIVVVNADLVYAYNKLLPPTKYAKKIGNQDFTSSSISFYWGMNKVIDKLSTHNIFLAEEYKKSFDKIFKDLSLPDEPSFYVNVPSRIDPSAAPPGKDTLVVLVPTGHLSEKYQDVDELVKKARRLVISTLEKRLEIDNFEQFIECELHNDPRIWEKRFNLWKGSILGLTHSVLQVLWFRPGVKSHLFDQLYFVGASAHPGTGVPVVLCGAKLCEQEILRKYNPRAYAMVRPNESAIHDWGMLLIGLVPLVLLFVFYMLFHLF